MLKMFGNRNVVFQVGVILILCMSLSSCETFRKKFTRKKRKATVENTDFIPVLEPIDYPDPVTDPVKVYKQNYHLLKSWHRDLSTLVQEKDSDKRQIYTLNQIFNNIAEMQRVVTPEKSAQLAKLAEGLTYYRNSLNEPVHLRNVARLQSDLRSFHRMLLQLNANKIEGDFLRVPQS